jgi:hypothetical protein
VIIRASAVYANSMRAYTLYANPTPPCFTERLRRRFYEVVRTSAFRRRLFRHSGVFSIHAAAIQTLCFADDTIPLNTLAPHCSVRGV